MNAINRVFNWAEVHHPAWLDYIRIVLGIIIFSKGIEFARDPQFFEIATNGLSINFWTVFLVHYIPMVHLVGGLLICLGLITRIAVLFQLPILIGAVLFAGMTNATFDLYSDFGLSLTVLVALLVFLVYGSGPLSIDNYMDRHPGD